MSLTIGIHVVSSSLSSNTVVFSVVILVETTLSVNKKFMIETLHVSVVKLSSSWGISLALELLGTLELLRALELLRTL